MAEAKLQQVIDNTNYADDLLSALFVYSYNRSLTSKKKLMIWREKLENFRKAKDSKFYKSET